MASEPPASPGLDLRYDQRPVRRSGMGQLTGALLRRAQGPVHLDNTGERTLQGFDGSLVQRLNQRPALLT
jgi:hypothetical protein